MLGATRVVSAREMSMEELVELRANIPPSDEIETSSLVYVYCIFRNDVY